MRNVRILAVALALAALAMLLLSGPGTRAGWWDWRLGISLLRYAVYVGGAAAILSLVLVVLLAVPKWRVRPWLPVLALCAALVAVAPPLILLGQAKAVPPIHDITTDVPNRRPSWRSSRCATSRPTAPRMAARPLPRSSRRPTPT